MATWEFKLPDIGEGVVEGEIVKWLVKAGDEIKEDQPLVEVMTDKATVTIPSPKKGRVTKTHGKEGDIAKVHAPLVTLEVEGTQKEKESPPLEGGGLGRGGEREQRAASSNGSSASASSSKVLATPVTRRMAREHGIDLTGVSGSGPQGRVTKADVMAAMGGSGAVATGNVTSA